jgi:hypothetical protein
MTNKPNLTFEEEVTCAYLHYVRGVTQEIVAAAFATNQGRVNEACVKIKRALLAPSKALSKKRLAEIAAIPDDQIDTSDIPEAPPSFFERAGLQDILKDAFTVTNRNGEGK